YTSCVPQNDDPNLETVPLLDFAAGYVLRSLEDLPSAATKAPWRLGMNYAQDAVTLRHGSLEDDAMRFSRTQLRTAAAVASQRRPLTKLHRVIDGPDRDGASQQRALARAQSWAATRTHAASEYPVESIVSMKGSTSVSVVIPAKSVGDTIANVAAECVALRDAGAIDEVIVIDANSTDD